MDEKIRIRVPDLNGNMIETIGQNTETVDMEVPWEEYTIDKVKTTDNMFNEYYDKWYGEVKHISSHKMFENKYYKEIISLGINAVPCIIKKLKEAPAHLFRALTEITGQDPVPKDHWGDIEQMAQDWIEWWEKRGCA